MWSAYAAPQVSEEWKRIEGDPHGAHRKWWPGAVRTASNFLVYLCAYGLLCSCCTLRGIITRWLYVVLNVFRPSAVTPPHSQSLLHSSLQSRKSLKAIFVCKCIAVSLTQSMHCGKPHSVESRKHMEWMTDPEHGR